MEQRPDRNTECLDFEKPVVALDEALANLQHYAVISGEELNEPLALLTDRINVLKEHLRTHMPPWERVLMARHPSRPRPADYVKMLFSDYMELHGDRRFGDDRAIVGGFAMFDKQPVMLIYTRKGRDPRDYMDTHFGCAQPEGYRKALRLMRLADKADCPIITMIDTPGAYPGIGSEERHVGEAIAMNLREMFRLRVPVVAVITGEGGSGGALGLAVGNRVLMFANSYYSAITPEGCAAILWRKPEKAPDAAAALHLTAEDLLKYNIIDEIIPEPPGGAHRDPAAAGQFLKAALQKQLKELRKKSHSRLVDERYRRFRKLGVFAD